MSPYAFSAAISCSGCPKNVNRFERRVSHGCWRPVIVRRTSRRRGGKTNAHHLTGIRDKASRDARLNHCIKIALPIGKAAGQQGSVIGVVEVSKAQSGIATAHTRADDQASIWDSGVNRSMHVVQTQDEDEDEVYSLDRRPCPE